MKVGNKYYLQVGDKFRHVTVAELYQQVDIFGDKQDFARVKLSAKSKVLHETECSKLLAEKPDKREKQRIA